MRAPPAPSSGIIDLDAANNGRGCHAVSGEVTRLDVRGEPLPVTSGSGHDS